MLNATILILHYLDDDVTNDCLDSLIEQAATCNAHIVVIDNASPIPFHTPHSVIVHRLTTNLHLVPAFGEAMRHYPNEVYGLLNNDLFCHENMLRTVLKCFDDPDVGIVAPGSSDGDTGLLYVPFPDKWGNEETEQVDNHCFWISRELVETIGYPEADGHTHRANWCWNRYYCYLARQAGYKIIAACDAYVDHRRAGGYDRDADIAGQRWLLQRLGERAVEAW